MGHFRVVKILGNPSLINTRNILQKSDTAKGNCRQALLILGFSVYTFKILVN